MSNLAIVFGVVLFSSAGNAFSWTGTMQDMHKKVHEVTNSVISKIESEFESTKTKAAAQIVQLENETNKFGSEISDKLSSISDNLGNALKKLADEVNETIVKECIKSDDKATLAHLSDNVMTKTGECVGSKLASGVEYAEVIKNLSNDVLEQIGKIKEKAQHCGDDVRDAKSTFWAIYCSKSTAASATWTSLKAAPQLAVGWTKLKFLMVTLQPSLIICTKTGLMDLLRGSSILMENTKGCIEKKFAKSGKNST